MTTGGAKKRAAGPTKVDVIRHDDKRTNIPTDELRSFVADDEKQPKKLVYARDTSLDPQLVWRGKDVQDEEGLEVPAVPIYIQEKLHPRVLIENLRQTAAAGEDEPELALFSDFNGIEFEDLVDFYHHEQNWTNRLILGDSLLVMASLAEKEALRGKVQTIFIDPPYGINFSSNWQVSTQQRDVKDGKLDHVTRQPEQIRAFRDTWKDGINTYLGYLRDRLTVARDLLTDSGSIFVQIGDENVHLVRSLLDEVFGADNFVNQIAFKKTSGAGSPTGASASLPAVADYLLWYGKDKSVVKYRPLYRLKQMGGEGASAYTQVEMSDGNRRPATTEERRSGNYEGRVYRLDNLTSQSGVDKTRYEIEFDGKTYRPGKGVWKTSREGMERLLLANRVAVTGGTPKYVRYIDDFPAFPLTNSWDDTVIAGFGDPKVYVVQTSTKVVERCILMTSDPGDLVLDPTSGSGSTAVAAEEWGRRWIAIDTSRVAIALARTRLTALRLPYYLLSDSVGGQDMEERLSGRPVARVPVHHDVRKGFVYERVPHIMLRDIAQNDEIKPGMSPAEIAEAIRRGSEKELLLDRPVDDKRTVRVCGPFTVESLSPHRMLSEEDVPDTEDVPESSGDYEQTILGNLLKAGVQNRDREQRLNFDTLESYAGGQWVHARGTFVDEDGHTRTVGVSLGPEYGTVGSDQVREAAKEAVKGVGFDMLLVCGFAFDAHTGEAAKEFKPDASDDGGGWAVATEERKLGRLPVMLVRMNQDLSMGEDLLKKTGAGNLFMVFGEPDIVIDRTQDGQIEVEVRGVDVYNPTTGEIRSDSTDDIACWFIDTNYNGESFFVRDAYFTGANDPYKRLRQALKADIDEDAWETLYRTRSRPFAPPATGTIAVKVINHHGDEVLKTYPVA